MPLIQLGAYYLHEGRTREAIFRLEEAIELASEDVDAHYLLGEAYYRDNDVVSALDQWAWVESVQPDRAGLAERLEAARREEQIEADYTGRASRHFNVTYSREAEGAVVRDVLAILEEAYRDVGRMLGNNYPPTPVQVSLYTQEGFQQTTLMDAHVGALYDGSKIRCPVIGPDGNPLPRGELRRRLYHEYVHVVVRHIAKDGVPWWLNEGLAEALTIELTPREREFLRHAKQNDALFDLEQLTDGQLGKLDAEELYLAYKQSQATVSYLKQRFGTRRLTQVLAAIGGGEDIEVALRRTLRCSYSTLQLAVAEYVQNG
jgi:tetratricopeptide (TPR) repeat protein